MPRDEYFIVQKAYPGWNQLGYLLAIQFIPLLTLVTMSPVIPPAKLAGIASLALL